MTCQDKKKLKKTIKTHLQDVHIDKVEDINVVLSLFHDL